jgi:hypothetical protein
MLVRLSPDTIKDLTVYIFFIFFIKRAVADSDGSPYLNSKATFWGTANSRPTIHAYWLTSYAEKSAARRGRR